MPLFDLPLDQLHHYQPARNEPADFDQFWSQTLDEAAQHPLSAAVTHCDSGLAMVDVYDVTFAGYNGDRVNAWLIAPKTGQPNGCVVKYIGYHGGRGFAHSHLLWAAAGWTTVVMDTRGQGGSATSSHGHTGDPHGTTDAQAPGMLTKGIDSPYNYYYRRVIVDALRMIDVAGQHPSVDSERIATVGHSQGGGLAQAVAAMHPRVKAASIDVPFLNDFRRAAEISTTGPYPELVQYLSSRRDDEHNVFTTLSYFDGVNFASRGTVPAQYSAALMDTTCPPSTVFGAYNHWKGPKHIEVWPWNGHESGAEWHVNNQLEFLRAHLG